MPNRNIRPGERDALKRRMREAFPQAGDDIYKFMEVTLKPGERISVHKHAHHLMMYYPELADPITITPQPGTMLYLPAGTAHAVGAVKKPRLSIAMLIEEIK